MSKPIPKYVQEIMERSRYEFDFYKGHEHYAVGYTIKIRKHSAYAHVATLKHEVERLMAWANRVAGMEISHVLDMPKVTHHYNQVAVVTIYDPVMQMIEKYIPKN